MRSTSGHDWEIRRLVPSELRRPSLYSACFCIVVAGSFVIAVVGAYLVWDQQIQGDRDPSFAPYVVVLISTAAGIFFASAVWGAAGRPVVVSDWNAPPDYESELAPPHLQKWTYQENRDKGPVATIVAAIWHCVGLFVLVHYCLLAWPRIGPGILPILVYELLGLIPVALAVRGWRRRKGTHL